LTQRWLRNNGRKSAGGAGERAGKGCKLKRHEEQ
jgi:hypothetical protein